MIIHVVLRDRLILCYKLVARIFCGGGGLHNSRINQDQIINVGMIRHASFKGTRAACPTLILTQIGATFNGRGNFASASNVSGLGACPPRKFSLNLKALIKRLFQRSQADSCAKKVLKTNRYFLNFDKKSIVISCSVTHFHN